MSHCLLRNFCKQTNAISKNYIKNKVSLVAFQVRTIHKSGANFENRFDRYYFGGNNLKTMNVQDTVEELTQVCFELRRRINLVSEESEKEKIVLKHIKKYEGSGLKVNDFSKGLEWFNVSESLSIYKHLAGKIVLLDFFTYCCINCMHILPDLDALEKKFSVKDGLVVIGVHSAKFANERDSSKVLSAAQRYHIDHPVVNDARLSMWRDIGISCWPSLVIIGPQGQPLFVLVGEGHREEFFLYSKVALKYFKEKNKIKDDPIPLQLAKHILPQIKNTLLFPGKIHSYLVDSKEKLAVSDTGNNRILIMTNDGNVEHVIGGYSPGFQDGNFESARFNSPQGICFYNDSIYVADNENHAIRKICFKNLTVTTIAGTGFQGHDYAGGKIGTAQALSSPWDVAIYMHEQKERKIPVLIIAIAGTHQIWALFLEDTVWWKNRKFKAGACANIVGNGREANKNNIYPENASLAQPSGLALAQELKSVFFADSESSTIRRVCLDDGKVFPVCGADKNPANLHCFGDEDGKMYSAKLQHPLGVAWNSQERVTYVADTYNHKIKKVDAEGNCITVCGTGKPSKNHSFDEPSGLTVNPSGNILYIADTNNHCIKELDLKNLDKIQLIPVNISAELWNKGDLSYNFKVAVSTNDADISFSFSPIFENDLKLNTEAPQKWFLYLPDDEWKASKITGDLDTPIFISIPKGTEQKQVHISLNIMTCKTSECVPKNVSIVYTVIREDNEILKNVIENKKLVIN